MYIIYIYIEEEIDPGCLQCKKKCHACRILTEGKHFKIDFGLAFKELRENQVTSTVAGFAPHNKNAIQDFCAETAEAIDQLANATIVDRNVVRSLTDTNTQITNNLMQADQQLAEALATITTLQGGFQGGYGGCGGRGKRGVPGGRGGQGGSGGRGGANQGQFDYTLTKTTTIHMDVITREEHTRAMCNTPGPNHRIKATIADNMGGSQRHANLVGW